ncbi:hypothetical protein D3C71_135960 [compost metagenome]
MVRLAMPDVVPGSDIDPIVVLDRFAETSPAKARRGLSMAIGDIVEMTSNWPLDKIVEADRQLSAADLPSLSAVCAKFSKAVAKIVRKGVIANDAEFYLVRNATEMTGDHRQVLLNLAEAYEGKAVC